MEKEYLTSLISSGPWCDSRFRNQQQQSDPMTKLEEQQATERAIEEFLAKGGTVTQVAFGKSGRVEGQTYSMWSKKKPSTSPLASPPEED